MIAVLAPPPHYDHPYRGPVVEMVMSLAQARALCRKQGVIADACSWTKSGKCYLVIPRGGPVKELAPYRRHEIAHCNGWSGRHGGQRTAAAARAARVLALPLFLPLDRRGPCLI